MDEIVDTAPAPSRDQGHPALGSTATIAKDPSTGIADDVFHAEQSAPSATGNSLLELVKDAGIPHDTVSQVLEWVEKGSTQSDTDLAARDVEDQEATTAELKALWGEDKWDKNVKALNRLLDGMPGSSGEVLRSARMADGRAVLNDAAFVARLLGVANRPGPKGSKDPAVEIKQILAFMRRDRAAYNRDEPMQARLREAYARQGANP